MSIMTGGEALVRALVAHDADRVFGIPGTHNLAIYAALDRLGVHHVLTRHEQGAGYAADGYARSSGRPGVVLTTTGPAILNAAAAALQAYSDSVPVFFVSPGVPTRHPGLGNGLLHEVRDQSAALAAIIGTSTRVTTVAEIPVAVAQLWGEMLAGRPRPVHLEIPLDLLDESADVEIAPPLHRACAKPDDIGLELAARVLESARSPLAIVGGGAKSAATDVIALVERWGAPVVTTANGKGVVPDGHPLLVGSGVGHESTRLLASQADVVLALGTELAGADWWSGVPEFAGRLVRLDVDPVGMFANRIPDVAVLGDLTESVPAVSPRLADRVGDDSAVDAARAWIAADSRELAGPYARLMEALATVLPPDTIVAGDNAMAVYNGALGHLPVRRPGGFLFPSGAGTLGFGLPAGIGAKLAHPHDPVLVLQGDGGLMFTVAELATAAQEGLALPIVVVDNGGFAEIRKEMADRHERSHAVDLGHPDFVGLANSLGCRGIAAEDETAVAAAVAQAFTEDRPSVIVWREGVR